jgi:hypothetical protein
VNVTHFGRKKYRDDRALFQTTIIHIDDENIIKFIHLSISYLNSFISFDALQKISLSKINAHFIM